ncbi:MAG: hypothetical protein ABIJ05_01240 [Patescibacteria group bacterium]
MAEALTARQTQILKSLIDEYIETAIPVGSENLDKKYNLGVSPATIRSEMNVLTRSGYLKQAHTSSGRIPTPLAMKFYIDQLMEEKQMSLSEEVKTREDVWDSRKDLDSLLIEATKVLADRTKNIAVAATDEGKIWRAGFSNIFLNPEFSEVETCASVFSVIEEVDKMTELFFQKAISGSSIDVLFGEDLGWPGFNAVGIVATHFNVHGKNAALGVIGPMRLSYSTVIPVLKYFKSIMEEVAL